MPHMEGIFINGEKAKFHPEDILDTDASQYTEEIGESVTAYLTEHLTNPSNPPIDTSLSIAGAAADAKETGDQISQLKSDLSNDYEVVKDVSFFRQGYWGIADGNSSSGNGWVASATEIPNEFVSIIAQDYLIYVLAYDANYTYIGTWNGETWTKTYKKSDGKQSVDFVKFRKSYPNYTFRLSIQRDDSMDFTPSTFANDSIVIVSKTIINKNDIDVVYGDIAKSSFWENGSLFSDGTKSNETGSAKNTRIRTCRFLKIVVPVTVEPKSGYFISITRYDANGTFENQFTAWSDAPYTISNPEKLYKIIIKESSNGDISSANVSSYIKSYQQKNTTFERLLAETMNVKVVSHRGFNSIAPENTLPAFEMSAAFGYKYVECDVLFTSDGVPVIMHDATINRTCCNASDGSAISGDVAIDSVTYEDLTEDYDACTPAKWATWKGVKVPTFAEFMYCCKAHNLHAWIELKNEHTYTSEEVALIISIVKQYGMEEHVTFISFSPSALQLVSAQWDTVEIGLNGSVENAELLKTGKNRVFMIFSRDSTSYASAVTAGYQLCFYEVNSNANLIGLSTNAYDSILTDKLLTSQVYDLMQYRYNQ